MVRALPFRTPTRLDPGRILAIAAAIALHVFALLLLLMPMAAPQLVPAIAPKPVIRWIEREKPIEPIPVEITRKQPVTETKSQPSPRVQPKETTPITDTPVIVDGGTEPAVATQSSESVTDAVGPVVPSGPISASHLEYISAPAPRYPPELARIGVTGTVMLRVLVDVDGTPLDVSIESSSGNRKLDREASQHVLKKWRFKPAMQNGVAVQAYGIVPIAFTLQ
ncbi:TonB family protein [Pseudoxanthomonas beigongshangi]